MFGDARMTMKTIKTTTKTTTNITPMAMKTTRARKEKIFFGFLVTVSLSFLLRILCYPC